MKLAGLKINNIRDKALTLLILCIVLAVYKIFDIPCVFDLLLNIPCPSCGMTRAYISLLHLDFYGAFSMHPMFWSVPVLLLYYLFDWKLFKVKWLDSLVLVLIGAGFLINWIVKICGVVL